jgi:hypothetical protein
MLLFDAVMKRTILAPTFMLALLFSLLIGTQIFDVAYGNFVPTSPDNIPPIISIISPTNRTYENDVLLHLDISTVAYYQRVNYVEYTLDDQKHLVYSEEIKDLNWSTILEGLSEGPHSLKVAASCKSYYATSTSGGTLFYRTYDANSDILTFTVVYPPEVFILSLENKTYNTNNIPLNFEVNEPVSKIEYCLDGQENITIEGNVTLTGLNNGPHNVTIYATDADGHIGLSETVYFITDTFPTTLVLASVATIAIVGSALLVYFIKRKRQA